MAATRSGEKPKSILKKAAQASTPAGSGKGKAKEDAMGAKAASRGTKRAGEEQSTAAAKKQAKPVKEGKKAGKAKIPKKAEPVQQVSEEDEEEEEAEEAAAAEAESEGESEEDDDGSILHGLSDADSSDEDEEGDESEITKSGVVKLPSSRDDVVVKSRLDNVHKKKKESGRSSTPIVLYFGRVPKSMPEEPLRTYLSQFGNISRLRLSRNRKTGASKHFAFVEFEDEEVGQIVQETMNNYLLEGRLLQVRVLPKEKVHPSLWVGANKKWRKVPESRRFRIGHDKPKTAEEKAKVEKKLVKRQDQRRKKIAEQGIEYDFEGYA